MAGFGHGMTMAGFGNMFFSKQGRCPHVHIYVFSEVYSPTHVGEFLMKYNITCNFHEKSLLMKKRL